MKKIILSTLAAFACMGCFYLIGCFSQNSFSLSDWNSDFRGFVGTIFGLTSMFIGIVIYSNAWSDKI